MLSNKPCSWRFFSSSRRSASALNFGLPACLRSLPVSLTGDLLRLLIRVRVSERRLEQFGIENQGVEIIAHGIDVYVLVDQFDGLRAESVPQEATQPG